MVIKTFIEFHNRICLGHYNDDEAWRKEVGYRPDDRDGGFKRWLELTGNKSDDFIADFRRANYGEEKPKITNKIIFPLQLSFDM